MTEDVIKKLIEVCVDADKAELIVLQNAVIDTLKSYRTDPTSIRKKDWDCARQGLDDAVARLTIKYFPNKDTAPSHKNLLEMVKYLQTQGYKVKKSKVYEDRKKGLIRVQEDGSVLHSDVKLYAALLDRTFGDSNRTAEEVLISTKEKELELLELKIARARHEYDTLQGKYFPRSDFELELAGRAAVLDVGLRQAVRVHSGQIIATVAGESDREEALLKYIDLLIDEVMNGYAAIRTFQVIFTAEQTELTAEHAETAEINQLTT